MTIVVRHLAGPIVAGQDKMQIINRPIVNAFTVDVEDYYHVSAFADRIRRSDWNRYESRVVQNTHRILKLLDHCGVSATFFILGWVADQHPQLVKDIQRDGHEIACHSYWHRLVYDLSPDEFRDDLRRSTDAIRQLTGDPVRAYRAPSFSITSRSLWALDVLIEEGYEIDSSIFPIRHDRYGMPNYERFPHSIRGAWGNLTEFPASVHRVCNVNVPVAGGGYFRLYPIHLTLHWLRLINRNHGEPFVFYIHPWEVDPDQPKLSGNRQSRWRHYLNLSTTEAKLRRLLQEFKFGTLSESLAALPQRVGLPEGAAVNQRHRIAVLTSPNRSYHAGVS
jgi:polysaccharide deacetylase family protein (PEP-CTERM system associated)